MNSEKRYTITELLEIVTEYSKSHPEQTLDSGIIEGAPVEVYTAGAIDFLTWLGNGKKFPYNETYEDISDDDLVWLAEQGFSFLDKEKKDNIERDETY